MTLRELLGEVEDLYQDSFLKMLEGQAKLSNAALALNMPLTAGYIRNGMWIPAIRTIREELVK